MYYELVVRRQPPGCAIHNSKLKIQNYMRRFFQSEFYIGIILILVMTNNIDHGGNLYASITDGTQKIGYFVMITIDLAVLAFIFNGMKSEAWWYAAAICAIQLLDYKILSFWDPEANKWAAKIIFSGMFAYTLHNFSKIFKQKIEEREERRRAQEDADRADRLAREAQESAVVQQKTAELEKEAATRAQLEDDMAQLRSQYNKATEELDALRSQEEQRIAKLTCQHCGQQFASQQAAAGHQKHCDHKPQINGHSHHLNGTLQS